MTKITMDQKKTNVRILPMNQTQKILLKIFEEMKKSFQVEDIRYIMPRLNCLVKTLPLGPTRQQIFQFREEILKFTQGFTKKVLDEANIMLDHAKLELIYNDEEVDIIMNILRHEIFDNFRESEIRKDQILGSFEDLYPQFWFCAVKK